MAWPHCIHGTTVLYNLLRELGRHLALVRQDRLEEDLGPDGTGVSSSSAHA
jgi:hypothetical protein